MGLTRGRELDPGPPLTLVAKARPFNPCTAKSCIAVLGNPLLSNELPLSLRSWPVPRLPSASAVMLAPGHPATGAELPLVSGPGCLCRDSVTLGGLLMSPSASMGSLCPGRP